MRRLLISAALAGLLVSACGDDARTGNAGTPGTAGTSDTSGVTAPPVSTAPLDTASPDQAATAPEALQFSAPVVGGGELDMRAYAGQTVAFWFWAPT